MGLTGPERSRLQTYDSILMAPHKFVSRVRSTDYWQLHHVKSIIENDEGESSVIATVGDLRTACRGVSLGSSPQLQLQTVVSSTRVYKRSPRTRGTFFIAALRDLLE